VIGHFHSLLFDRLQPEDLPRLALDQHLKWPATDLAVRGEPLRGNTGVYLQVEKLAAKRALDSSGSQHARYLALGRFWSSLE
jgi:hypothetical protein